MLDRLCLPAALTASVLLPILGTSLTPDVDRESNWQRGWKAIDGHSDGEGFLVWESNRSGRWRIYRRDLSGEGLTQLTGRDDNRGGGQPGRNHFAPHISPDGTRVVYLTMPLGGDLYETRFPTHGELRIIDVNGDNDRVLADAARGYYEDRVALWIDSQELFYIHEDGSTRQLNVDTGATTAVTNPSTDPGGWFPNRQRTHITPGWPSFPIFQPEQKRVLFRRHMVGCQPYFSADGLWGYWTGGAGGPLNRFELATRKHSPILTRHDERLPESRRYLYFPMLSNCQTRFAFGASFYTHDHFSSDYDIFVSEMCPFTLEIIGKPQRYTFDRGCDRFPDVHLDDLALDKQRGMAPFLADFGEALKDDIGAWQIDFGDGSDPVMTATRSSHTYTTPGHYHVTATRTDAENGIVSAPARRGYVRVDVRTGPVALDATMVDESSFEVVFDTPLGELPAIHTGDGAAAPSTPASPPLTLDPEVASIAGISFGGNPSDRTTLRVRLDRTVREPFQVSLRDAFIGVGDRALPVAADAVPVRLQSWPVDPLWLAFAFQHAEAENLVPDSTSGDLVAFELQREGAAWLDRRMALATRGGTFLSQGAAANVLASVQEHNAFTFEAYLELESIDTHGTVVELRGPNGVDFDIRQEGTRLLARIRASKAPGAALLEIPLGRASKSAHVLVGVSHAVTFGRVNGLSRSFVSGLQNDLAGSWTADTFRIGDPETDWRGTLHHIAMFGRDRSDFETERDFNLSKAWLEAQPDVPRRKIQGATLVAKAKIPTLEELNPYREALSVFEYRARNGEIMRVAHWVLLDGTPTAEAGRAIGDTFDLMLEPFSAHPQVQSRRLEEQGLEANYDIELMFDTR